MLFLGHHFERSANNLSCEGVNQFAIFGDEAAFGHFLFHLPLEPIFGAQM